MEGLDALDLMESSKLDEKSESDIDTYDDNGRERFAWVGRGGNPNFQPPSDLWLSVKIDRYPDSTKLLIHTRDSSASRGRSRVA